MIFVSLRSLFDAARNLFSPLSTIAALILLFSCTSVSFGQTFAAPASYTTGNSPRTTAIADLNGDAKPDIVVINSQSQTLSVLLGNGDGTFQAAMDFPLTGNPFAITVADLNSDGKRDVAIANQQTTNISVLMGNGDGTLQPKVDYSLPPSSSPNAIASADLNGDSKFDLVVLGQTNGSIVFLNNGDGTFAAPVTYPVGTVNTALVIADFNSDGKRDLAVTVFDGQAVRILLGNGNGTFQTPVSFPLGLTGGSLGVADVNGDSKLDLVAANLQNTGISVLLGNGDGTFGVLTIYPAGSAGRSIALADFNGDSKTDVVIPGTFSGVMALVGNGDGSFRIPITFGSDAFELVAGDLNNDNKPDLVTTSGPTGSTISVLLNTTGPYNITGRLTDGFGLSVSPATVTLTGGTPIVGSVAADGTYSFQNLPAGGNFLVTPSRSNSVFIPTNRSFTNLAANQTADFKGLAINHAITGVVRDQAGLPLSGVPVTLFFLGASSSPTTITASDGSYAFPAVPAGGNYVISPSLTGYTFFPVQVNNLSAPRIANFFASPLTFTISGTAPGFSLISLAGSSSGLTTPGGFPSGNYSFSVAPGGTYTVRASTNPPGRPFSKYVINDPTSQTFSNLNGNVTANFSGLIMDHELGIATVGVVAGDFNSDNRPDVAATFGGTSAILRVFLTQASGQVQASGDFAVGCGGRTPRAADFNGDGKLDVATIDFCNDKVSVLLGNGDGTFQARQSYTVGSGPLSLAVGDFNNDNIQDLATVNDINNLNRTISILLGVGNGTFNAASTFINQSTSITVGDVNLDGKVDLVTPNLFTNNVGVLLGNGNGTFQPAVNFPVGASPQAAAVGDVNGDGKPDVIVSNRVDDTVSILLGDGAGAFGPQTTAAVGDEPSGLKLADFNGDGKLDIAVACADFGGPRALLGNGNGTFQPAMPSDVDAATFDIASGDFNNDNKIDLAAVSGNHQKLFVLFNKITNAAAPTISGQIKNPDNSPAAGVLVTLIPGGQPQVTTTTDGNGNYSFPNLVYGNTYIVRPSQTYVSFTPVDRAFQNITQDEVANFTATRNTPAIVGRVTDFNGMGLSGVTVNLSGTETATTTTGPNGTYSFLKLTAGGNYVVTPSFSSGTFAPPSRTHNDLSFTTVSDFRSSLTRTIQFSDVAYQVTEGTPSIAITLVRSGDVSGNATLSYTTLDFDDFTVNCRQLSGKAFGRCDFATSVDTVTFGPGETSKILQIPIIDDVWAEGDEKFSLAITDMTGATQGILAAVQITIVDNEAVNGSINPYFGTSFFVRQHYLDFLSREPETGEPWSGILNACSDVNNNSSCDRLFVSGSIFGSQEFQLKGYYNYRFYKLAFNRLPLYEEIVVDMRKVTGTTQQDTFDRRARFANDFVLRTEFMTQYNAMSDTQYVNTLMNRYSLSAITTRDPNSPETGGMVTLTTTDLINALKDSTMTRAQVLRAIADSQNVFTAEFNQGFVAFQYYGYLRRIPDTAGYNAWLTYMNAHPNDFRTMVNGFMNSDEYRKRFGPNPDNP